MPNSLTYCDLPAEIHQWPGLPLSLSGDEVMPLDYRAGHTGWLLYGRKLDKISITQFQRQLGRALVIVSAWAVEGYQVVRLAGSLTADVQKLAESFEFDVTQLGKVPYLRVPGLLERVEALLDRHRPGPTPLRYDLLLPAGSAGCLDLNGSRSVQVDADLVGLLRAQPGVRMVKVAMGHKPWTH